MTTTFEQTIADGNEALYTWLRTKGNLLAQEQAEALGAHMNGSSDAEILFLWDSLQHNMQNLILVHPIVENAVVRVAMTVAPIGGGAIR